MSIHPVMQRLADKLKRTDLPQFKAGDQVRVQVKIKEGDKERLQAFEGLVIAINRGPQGTFTVRKTKARKGLNPRTGESIKVKAGKTVRFKASPSLKKAV